MLIQANNLEERYQAFCRDLEEGKRDIEVGWVAHHLCEIYFRRLYGFRPTGMGPRTHTDCFTFPSLGHDINVLRKMTRKSGLKLSAKARRGVRFLQRDFPVRRQPVRTSDLKEREARLIKDTVEEIRTKVLELLPEDWWEAKNLGGGWQLTTKQ